MMLEDHVGDVIRKARRTASLHEERVAKAAGIQVNDLEILEVSGHIDKPVDWDRLGALVGLHGRKLALLASGWSPAPVDLSIWRELRCLTTTQDGNSVNCYLVWDNTTREAALFDTGWVGTTILQLIREHQLQLDHIFLTHNHVDHSAALDSLRHHIPSARLHSGMRSPPQKTANDPADSIHLGNLRITTRSTPGHSADSLTYVISQFPENAPHVALVGDALFAGSIGRGFQSTDLLKTSIREQIFTLPPDTLLCPGHGPMTTVSEQKECNPFFD